jgi:hypothetical protein
VINPFFTRKGTALKREVKSDPQRHRLYRMERDFIGAFIDANTKRKTLEHIVTHACNKYKIRRPKLRVVKRPDRVFGWCTDEELYLNRDFHGNNIGTLLHELAHWVVDEVFDTAEEVNGCHGPQFAAIYMHLLVGYKVLPEVAFRYLADEWQVAIDESLKNPYD